jgi:hypothetical protein
MAVSAWGQLPKAPLDPGHNKLHATVRGLHMGRRMG